MTVKYLKSATAYFLASGTEKQFPSMAAARKAAEAYVGNRLCTKMFMDEEAFLYGPGNGDTTVMVRQDIDMDDFMGRTAKAET